MDESLPAERGEVRPEISELKDGEPWLSPDGGAGSDEPERPETD